MNLIYCIYIYTFFLFLSLSLLCFEVKLVSEFVRPDLELSSDSIDFGHVPVGQVKRITIKQLGCRVQLSKQSFADFLGTLMYFVWFRVALCGPGSAM